MNHCLTEKLHFVETQNNRKPLESAKGFEYEYFSISKNVSSLFVFSMLFRSVLYLFLFEVLDV